MEKQHPDVIVIGAGISGLCCAGELVLQGARPLVICEQKEVATALRPSIVDGNRGSMQIPTWQLGWGGGWWPMLARRLNVPVRAPRGFGSIEYTVSIEGDDTRYDIGQSALSAASLVEELITVFPMLAGSRDELNRVFGLGYAIPYEQLVTMHRVPITEWLEDHKVDEFVSHMIVMLSAFMVACSAEFVRAHVSVYTTFALLRSTFGGEATFAWIYPDIREGLAIPMAREIERHGGTIMRGQRVAEVDTSAGRVRGVVMEDGTEIAAPIIAMACTSSRIADLLKPIPPEVEAPLAYAREIEHRDFNVFAVLDKPVVPQDSQKIIGVVNPAEACLSLWMEPLHVLSPWSTQPGKQFVAYGMLYQPHEVAAQGGEDAIFARLHERAEVLYPGLKDATCATKSLAHLPGHLWYGNLTTGPKLPRTTPSVEGLWFVGESSEPTCGIWMEAAASGGILGARAMATHTNK